MTTSGHPHHIDRCRYCECNCNCNGPGTDYLGEAHWCLRRAQLASWGAVVLQTWQKYGPPSDQDNTWYKEQFSKKSAHAQNVTRNSAGFRWSLAWGSHYQTPRFALWLVKVVLSKNKTMGGDVSKGSSLFHDSVLVIYSNINTVKLALYVDDIHISHRYIARPQ